MNFRVQVIYFKIRIKSCQGSRIQSLRIEADLSWEQIWVVKSIHLKKRTFESFRCGSWTCISPLQEKCSNHLKKKTKKNRGIVYWCSSQSQILNIQNFTAVNLEGEGWKNLTRTSGREHILILLISSWIFWVGLIWPTYSLSFIVTWKWAFPLYWL